MKNSGTIRLTATKSMTQKSHGAGILNMAFIKPIMIFASPRFGP
jgi:hypothetical protein